MAVLQFASKCSRTIVYAPLLNRIAPFEHLNMLRSVAKSRIVRGPSNKIWDFETGLVFLSNFSERPSILTKNLFFLLFLESLVISYRMVDLISHAAIRLFLDFLENEKVF
jgi:hypothetical protein